MFSTCMVRSGRFEDLPRVRTIFTACFTPGYVSHGEIQDGRATPAGQPLPEAVDLLEREIQSSLESFPEAGLIVAEANSQVVGFLATRLHQGKVAYAVCNDLCVLPEFRRSGVATELVEFVCRALRARGIHLVFAESSVVNGDAHQLLVEKLAFRPVSQVFLRCLD